MSIDDAKAVRTALLERLAQLKSPYRDYLIDMAKLGSVTLQAGHVEIGRWTLREWSGRLVVLHRGPGAAVFHAADVAKTAGSWSVAPPTIGEIFLRPGPAATEDSGKEPGTP